MDLVEPTTWGVFHCSFGCHGCYSSQLVIVTVVVVPTAAVSDHDDSSGCILPCLYVRLLWFAMLSRPSP